MSSENSFKTWLRNNEYFGNRILPFSHSQ